MSNYVKYPSTYHLPWSLGVGRKDRVLTSVKHFEGRQVVVTEKMDGENMTLYRDKCHPRSIDDVDHGSMHWIKQFHSQISYMIHPEMRICGENLYAEHEISYHNLPSFFMCFSVWHNDVCLSWDNTVEYALKMGLHMVPVLYRGIWNEDIIKTLYTGVSATGGQQEGYVVRLADAFLLENFDKSIAKFVRQGHVTSKSHWRSKPLTRNKLIGEI